MRRGRNAGAAGFVVDTGGPVRSVANEAVHSGASRAAAGVTCWIGAGVEPGTSPLARGHVTVG